jgi:hypothetical protein
MIDVDVDVDMDADAMIVGPLIVHFQTVAPLLLTGQ